MFFFARSLILTLCTMLIQYFFHYNSISWQNYTSIEFPRWILQRRLWGLFPLYSLKRLWKFCGIFFLYNDYYYWNMCLWTCLTDYWNSNAVIVITYFRFFYCSHFFLSPQCIVARLLNYSLIQWGNKLHFFRYL